MSRNALTARLVHSKTIGCDKTLSHRFVVISERCYIRKREWLSCGWRLLSTKADFLPSGNLKGCLHRELRCDTAYALQRRVMDVLTLGQEKLFTHGVGHFSTPHSGRHFLPSAAAALNVEKSDCDMLGGWMAQESDRYNRIAKSKTWSRRLSGTEPTAIRSLKQMRWTSSLSFSNGKVQAKNSRQSISRSCRFRFPPDGSGREDGPGRSATT